MESDRGCCSTCDGTGVSGDAETNGKCWDCYGTGHTHAPNTGVITTSTVGGGISQPEQNKRFK
jgi:hypothetical protein